MKSITIVTVCYNEEKNIARTIESVLMQTANDYEYIICDGLSKDNTVSIAEGYQEAFARKGVSYRVFSERDFGIYDAMNKGVDKAEGKYIWFLNAGDWFCCSNAVERFAESIEKDSTPAVYYADFYFVENHLQRRCVCNTENIKKYMSLGHPSLVARADIMRERRFDTAYKIAADYNFVLGMALDGLEFRKLDFVATNYTLDGVSSTNKELVEDEVGRIHSAYGLPHEAIAEPEASFATKVAQKLIKIAPKPLWKLWCTKIKGRPWIEY